MTDELSQLPPPEPGHVIEEIHCWIAVDKNGGEGLISADMPFEVNGRTETRHLPLFSSKRDVIMSMAPLAQRAAKLNPDVKIRLASFIRAPSLATRSA